MFFKPNVLRNIFFPKILSFKVSKVKIQQIINKIIKIKISMREILAQGLGDGRHKYTSEGEKRGRKETEE